MVALREYEVRVPSIDPGKIREILKNAGAKRKETLLLRRIVYHLPAKEGHLKKWIRLRTDGRKTELTMKSIKSWKVGDVFEATTPVGSFEEAARILSSLGLRENYQEDIREKWTLPGAELTLDYWPRIPPLLEVEAISAKRVFSALKSLGIRRKDATTLGIDELYAQNGINLHSIPSLLLSKKEERAAGITGTLRKSLRAKSIRQ